MHEESDHRRTAANGPRTTRKPIQSVFGQDLQQDGLSHHHIVQSGGATRRATCSQEND